MIIEWDSKKNRENIKKHGIDFRLAADVFSDIDRIELYDEIHSVDEDRYITIGQVGEVLFVVYTERDDNVRLISARLADKYEREVYYDRKSKCKNKR